MAIRIDKKIEAPVILLTGASSQIGVFAIPRLNSAGFRVYAVSRQGKPARYPDFEQVSWVDISQAEQVVQDCDYLLSAGPVNLAHHFLDCGGSFKKVIVFSSSSVETKLDSANSAEKRQVQDLLESESELEVLAQNTNVPLLILRPTLIYGCGLDSNISLLAKWIERYGFMPVNRSAKGLRQPVHADDLASFAIDALFCQSKLPAVLNLTGGESLTYSDMVRNIFVALEKKPRLVHLPEWFFVLLVRVLGLLGAYAGVNAEMVKRQRHDLVFEDRQARQLLGYQSRPFAPTKADFSLPVF